MFLLKLTLSLHICVFSSTSRAISAAETPRWGCFEDLLVLTGTGPMSGSLCLQEIQPASQWPHPMVSAAETLQSAPLSFFFLKASHIKADNCNCVYVVFIILGSAYTWMCLSTHVPWCTLSQADSTRSVQRSMNTQTPGRRASNSW